MDEKGGKGTYLRVFQWAEYKDVPPLSSLAEIKTLKDEAGLNLLVLISTAYLINYMRNKKRECRKTGHSHGPFMVRVQAAGVHQNPGVRLSHLRGMQQAAFRELPSGNCPSKHSPEMRN
jgi:hypothetical protein